MKTRFLFSNRWRLVGYLMLILGLIFCFISSHYNKQFVVWHHFRNQQSFTGGDIDEGFDNEIQLAMVTIGLILIAFTKEKQEDEQIMQLRLDSLQWAVYVNYAVFFVVIFAFYGLDFFAYTMYNVLTLLVFFIIRFRWMIFKLNRAAGREVQII